MKELTKWADKVIKTATRPKFTQKNMVTLDWDNIPTRTRRIIGLHGKLQSGKDTVGNILIEKYGFKRLAFADALRQALYNLNPVVVWENGTGVREYTSFGGVDTFFSLGARIQDVVDDIGWEKAKKGVPEIRRLLQFLGTEAGRDIHGQDCWTNIVKRQIEAEPEQNFVITDVRFPNEKDMVEDVGGDMMHIIRNQETTSADTHASEQVIEGINYKILNEGTLEQLSDNVDTLYKHIIEGGEGMIVKCY